MTQAPPAEAQDASPARIGGRLIAAFCFVFAAYLLWTGYSERALAQAADRFEQVQGRVVDAGIKARGGTDQRSARVVIAYEVGAEAFELQSNGHDAQLRFKGNADALLAAYPIGRELPVYYDPQGPQRAALSAEVEVGRAWASGWALLGLALAFSVWLRRRRVG